MKIPDIKLNTGNTIPQVGLGLWQVKDEADFRRSFETAFEAGYTHFDSAQFYQNEHFIGNAIKELSIKREKLFITTKIAVTNFGAKRTAKSFQDSLEKLQTEYVDLLLLHFPVSILRKNSWLELEKIQKAGGAKNIGVSNYTVKHLEEMQSYANVKPAVNQVELHLFLQQPELVQYCRTHDIVIEAYSPLAHAADMSDLTIQAIAKKHYKTYAQVMLRWLVQQGFVVLPKSVTPERVRENIDIFDFELDDEDLLRLSKLDHGMRTCWDPTHVP